MKKIIEEQCPLCGEGPFVWNADMHNYECAVCGSLIDWVFDDYDEDSGERDYDTEEWQAFEEGWRPDKF